MAITAQPIQFLAPEAPTRFRRAVSTTDFELMRLVSEGDRDAFAATYERHSRAALGVALRMTRSREAAEEVVQEAFVNLWSHAGSYSPERGAVRAFVLGIVRHRALDALRREASRSRLRASAEGLEETHEAPDRTDDEAARREEAASVRAALDTLPAGQARAIRLAYFEGLSHSEIGSYLQLPIGTVKSRIRLGLAKLRGELPQLVLTPGG